MMRKTDKILEQAQKRILAKKGELSMEELNFLALYEVLQMMWDANAILNNIYNK